MIKKYWEYPNRNNRFSGYTLLELMVVSGIISILAAMSFALLSRMKSQAIETNAMAALNTMATGYEMYYYMNKKYPQWGLESKFATPTELMDELIAEEFIPRSLGSYEYDPDTSYFYGITQDYAMEIIPFNPDDPTVSVNSYFIILHPYNFQRDALAIGINPITIGVIDKTQWIAVRARRGPEGGSYRLYKLFVTHRGGAGD